MQARIRNWVHSLANCIHKLVIATAPPVYDLDDLLDKVTAANLHGETDTGTQQGREAW